MIGFQKGISIVFIVIGVVLFVETLRAPAGAKVGFLAAVVFVALGVLRWRAIHPPQ